MSDGAVPGQTSAKGSDKLEGTYVFLLEAYSSKLVLARRVWLGMWQEALRSYHRCGRDYSGH